MSSTRIVSWRLSPRRIAALAGPVGLVALAALGGGCGETTAPPPPSPSPTTTATPVDELAPDELSEGRATAFGFPFPSELRVESRSGTRVSARGPARFEDVANYVRGRVDAGQTSTGPGKTVFDRVTIKEPRPLLAKEKPLSTGDTAEEVLRIDVVAGNRGWTHVVVSREARPKPIEGLTEDQRWERLGLTKDGRPADPNQFE